MEPKKLDALAPEVLADARRAYQRCLPDGTSASAAGTPPPDLDRQAARRFAELMRWGIPYREALIVLGHDVKPFRDTEALMAAREFLDAAGEPGGPNILVLAGPKGVGKTCAGVYVADVADPPLRFGLRWSDKQHPIFRHVTDLSAMGLFDRDAKQDAQRHQLVTAKVVVLDDLGTEYQDKGGLFLALLDWFLDKRYGSAGLTVVTTNLGTEEFQTAYGERIYDRLVERCAWRDINHESLRG